MFEDSPIYPRQVIRRTVRITTVEEWTITIETEGADSAPAAAGRAAAAIAPINDGETATFREDT